MTGSRYAIDAARATRAAASVVVVLILFAGCSRDAADRPNWPAKLSSYGLYRGNLAAQQPADGVVPYDLNTALFSDYTAKYRFIRLPEGTRARYDAQETFDFPVGTVVAKTFTQPHDLRDPGKGERLLETRILKHEAEGWIGLPYRWNEEQTEATLVLAGGTVDVSWIHTDGRRRENNYIIPNVNQCKGCHRQGETMELIGPKARHLNRDFVYAHGSENQLAYWSRTGILEGAPDPRSAPRAAVWDDHESGTLDERARAWLEINCAHCHQPGSPAQNSGLDLLAGQTRPVKFGVFKPPVAAGRGSGGLAYDIVPGKPEESILMYRISSTDPDTMMPELGKRLVHEEGVALIRDWIAAMPGKAEPQERKAQRRDQDDRAGSRPEGRKESSPARRVARHSAAANRLE